MARLRHRNLSAFGEMLLLQSGWVDISGTQGAQIQPLRTDFSIELEVGLQPALRSVGVRNVWTLRAVNTTSSAADLLVTSLASLHVELVGLTALVSALLDVFVLTAFGV